MPSAPNDVDIAEVLQKISWRVIHILRRLGYLETDIDNAMAAGSDPHLDNEPELARTLAASVKQRSACGERAGQNVRRIGSSVGCEGERPELTGPRCASVNGFSLHANTQIPAHRRDQLERLPQITKRLWAYIKEHDLQDSKNRRMINADAKLQPVVGGQEQISMFDLPKLVSRHVQ